MVAFPPAQFLWYRYGNEEGLSHDIFTTWINGSKDESGYYVTIPVCGFVGDPDPEDMLLIGILNSVISDPGPDTDTYYL
jgi:hypothetical protein